MSGYIWPALFALFVWWFSTGVIIFLDGLPQKTFKWSMAGGTVVLAGSMYGLMEVSSDTSVQGAYLAFTFGLLAWGWQEMSLYMGYVTGPRKERCQEGCSGWPHFFHAIQTILWHELAIIAGCIALAAICWNMPNQIGLWTFIILWWMHQSAKLNVFLGVRNLNEEFLPDHLQFLTGFLRRRPMNLLFPISVTVSTVICVWLAQQALAANATAFEVAGYTFLTTLMALAILEHWFLVLPLPAAKLWYWGLKSRTQKQPFEVDIAVGFLGAGKTTFLRRLLGSIDPDTRTVALVNDFSEMGVDSSLLQSRGAEVVELPNGCICCSLRQDLTEQLKEVATKWEPKRVLIEPSGVADVASLLTVLQQPEISVHIKSVRMFTLIDAGAFLNDYARLPGYFEAHADAGGVFIVNKTDLVSEAEVAVVAQTLNSLNPSATILPATFGRVDMQAVEKAGHELKKAGKRSDEDEDLHEHSHSHSLRLSSWSTRLSGVCDPAELQTLLDDLAVGEFGSIERVKGVTRAGAGWIRFDVAGGHTSISAFAPTERDEPRVVAIGSDLDEARLQSAFETCVVPAMEMRS